MSPVFSYDTREDPPEDPRMIGDPLSRMGLSLPGGTEVSIPLWIGLERLFASCGESRHFVAHRDGDPIGFASVMINRRLDPPGETAYFGLLELPEATAEEALSELLPEMEAWCRDRGASALRGPISYSTWHANRFVTSETVPHRFPGDTTYPARLLPLFQTAGFIQTYSYFSTISEPLEQFAPKIAPAIRIATRGGITLKRAALPEFSTILPQLHPICLGAFASNYSYTPIDLKEFTALYANAGALPDPLVLTARDGEGTLLGFVFGYEAPGFPAPDGSNSRVAVLKSIATDPGSSGSFVGAALSAEFHRILAEEETGYRYVIHALMAREKYATGSTSDTVNTIREYGMFEKALESELP